MSQANVDAFKRALEAYNRRDTDAFLEAFDPVAEIHPLTLAMFGKQGTTYRGHEGIREFIRDVEEVLPGIQIEPLEVRDLGERIVANGRLHAQGRSSGAEVESPIAWLVGFRAGKIVRMRDFLDLQNALEAAGLTE